MRSLRDRLVHNPLRLLFDEARLPRDIRRSLYLILLGNIFGTFCGIICGGGTTAMIGLANELGAGDFAFGLLNGIPQAAALLQIPFSLLVSRTGKRKRYMLTFGVISRALWLLFGLIPVLVPMQPEGLRLRTLIFLLGLSSCLGASINVCWFPWFSDLTPIGIRGRLLSFRETLLAGCNFLVGLLVAMLLDALPPENRYIIIFLIGGTVGILDMVCFGFCKEVFSAPPKKQKFFTVLRQVLQTKPFLRLILMWTAWCFTANLSGAYLSRYAMNEMGLNFTQMMIFGTMAASVSTILIMPHWGRALDRYGCRSVMLISGV